MDISHGQKRKKPAAGATAAAAFFSSNGPARSAAVTSHAANTLSVRFGPYIIAPAQGPPYYLTRASIHPKNPHTHTYILIYKYIIHSS